MQKGSKDTLTISVSDKNYPDKLRHLYNIPEKLYVKGDEKLLTNGPIVGIVGARKLTPYGREVTDQITRKLTDKGITIVSGLALGVDSVAHRANVETGGKTIAILPCGIDLIYPSSHHGLAKQILERGGALVSEYEGTMPAMQHQFIERNRIIAALSDILIITEAAEKSGSLHTARFALELGKTIMVVPGPITSPYSRGTNRLIQNGALPLLDPSDVLEQLGIAEDAEKLAYIPENEIEAAILDALKNQAIPSEELLYLTGLNTQIFQTHLTMLEIKGVIEAQSGHWHIRS